MSHKAKRKARVLVAEDEPMITRLFGAILERAGYEADIAVSGHEVVSMWENGSYDLILMDLEMPEMTGLDAAVAIRRKEATLGTYTPIIAVTAWTLDGEERLCDAAGIDHYLPKPINIKETLLLIKETLLSVGSSLQSCS